MGFEEFVNWIQLSSDTCVHPSPHRYQLDWFKDNSGKVVADFIGKFEHIEEDWAYVAHQLNIGEPLPHENCNEGSTLNTASENKRHVFKPTGFWLRLFNQCGQFSGCHFAKGRCECSYKQAFVYLT